MNTPLGLPPTARWLPENFDVEWSNGGWGLTPPLIGVSPFTARLTEGSLARLVEFRLSSFLYSEGEVRCPRTCPDGRRLRWSNSLW
jgi:hypothetical protein